MNLTTLTSAATLKGYLMATDAPKDIIALAEQTVVGLMGMFAAPERREDGDVELAKATVPGDKQQRYREKCSAEGRCPHCGKPCAPFAECEERRLKKLESAHGYEAYKRQDGHGQRMPRRKSPLDGKADEICEQLATKSFGVVGHVYGVSGETIKNFLKRNGIDTAPYRKTSGRQPVNEAAEKAVSSMGAEDGGVDAAQQSRQAYCWQPHQKETLFKLKSEGQQWSAIAEAIGKTVSQCRAMFHFERNKAKQATVGAVPLRPPGGERWVPKLSAEQLPQILDDLKTLSFRGCGERHGVTGHAIIDFLKRSGVDHKTFKKKPGHGVKSPPSQANDDWPEAEKPERKMALVAEPKTPTEQPRMKFKSVKVPARYGAPAFEMQVAEPEEIYTDSETGKTVTKYPPGYAIGVQPQRNVSVKGGS